MSFRITNANGDALSMKELDQQAAQFWGKEVDPKYYATPFLMKDGMTSMQKAQVRVSGNWFDTIGWNIHHPSSNWTSGWDNIKASMWSVSSTSLYEFLNKPEQMSTQIEGIADYIKPYFALIDHWSSLGYIPVQVKE